MRTRTLMGMVAAVLVPATGCSSTSPRPPVTVEVEKGMDLGLYSAGAQSLDLYFAGVHDPVVYERGNLDALRVTKALDVSGGRSIKRFTVAPGETVLVHLGPMVHEHLTHVGVFADYHPRSGERSLYLRVAEIPADGKLRLILGTRGIVEFGEQ